MKTIKLVYTGRSGRFKHGKTYTTKWSFKTRGGSKSPSMWTFTLNSRFKSYRIMPYEFNKYWQVLDRSAFHSLVLIELYSDSTDYMRQLVYSKNPFLEIITEDPFQGACLPIPLVYGDKE